MARLISVAAAAMLALAGCSEGTPTVVTGHAISMRYDPGRVGGLPVSEGTSGPRGELPAVTARVSGSDGGDIDRLSLLAIDDIEEFWTRHYTESLSGGFAPVSSLVSYSSTDPSGASVCGGDFYQVPNAMYCKRMDTMAWDRAKFMPTARKYFGDMAINGTLAHEYGHAVQNMAGLVNPFTRTLVREQQADCFAGVYLQWVAAGGSSRAALSTGDGLNHVLAGLIVIRDPVSTSDNPISVSDAHGTALDRVGAFQTGFDGGADMCAQIDMAEIRNRRGDLPRSLFDSETPQSDLVIDEPVLTTLMAQLGQIFALSNPPSLSSTGDCGGGKPDPVAYCPTSNTIVVDLPELQQLSAPSDQSTLALPQGDNTGLSAVTSRYALAVAQQRGAGLDGATAALRTACLTGVAQRAMAEPMTLPSGDSGLMLAGGDLDEAITGLLMNGIAASDVAAHTVPAGFTRILAFRSGLHGDVDGCFGRFP